ncbi:unnamed protein product, partial [Rotaria magnacalcarata]
GVDTHPVTNSNSYEFKASCQLVRSYIRKLNPEILQYYKHQLDLTFRRHEFTTIGSQNLSNQSEMKGVLKTTAPLSIYNLWSTFDGKR